MIRVKNMAGLLDIVKALILNGYRVKIQTIYQEFPRDKHIDYFEINYE